MYTGIALIKVLQSKRIVSPMTHVFPGPLNPGEALIVQYLSKCWRWCFQSQKRPFFCIFEISKDIKIALLVQKLRQYLFIVLKSYSTFGKSPVPVPRSLPDKRIDTLCCKCCRQEVFDDSQFSGNIEGSQTHVMRYISCSWI